MWFALGTFFIVLGVGLALRIVCHSIEVASSDQVRFEILNARIEIRKELVEQRKTIVDEFQKTRSMLTYFHEKKGK